ncbi:hypothetical protein ND486_09145 [Pseudonocardia sp. DR1-2]|uniref:replication initiator n=1 Tax=Pseudonocardia sp. DR1-2 TaxID=2951168 RepID=UPI002042FA58|nr:replication initiator [Pseudonocardia sp. DR1-2]MCM3846354.1 hypothetical protein [Pseudonocardia sp. DR1-2]
MRTTTKNVDDAIAVRRQRVTSGAAPRPVQLAARDLDDAAEITTTAVAAYLAEYATKATETAGHLSTRLRPDTVRSYTDHTTHTGRQIDACWRLGQRPGGWDPDEWSASWGPLWRWAHMLGFAGHFSTRSRRYSTTLTALRQARRDWQRDHANPRPAADEVERLERARTPPRSSSPPCTSPGSAGTPPTPYWPTPPPHRRGPGGAPLARNWPPRPHEPWETP